MMRIGKFTDFYRDVTKNGTKIPQEKYLRIGKYPIIDQGRQNIAGRWDSQDGIFEDVPAIVFGDHTRAIKYIEEPFFIGADGVKILRPANEEDSPKYLYYALQAAKIPDLGYSRHFKALKGLEIRIYSREEQDEIVHIIERIDHLISQRNKEVGYLENLVKSRFIEMFGDMLLNTKRWNEQPLESMADIVSGITKGRKIKGQSMIKVPYMAVSNVKDGYIDWTTVKTIEATEQEIEQYRLLPDDVLMTEGGDPDKLGRGAIIKEPLENCIHQNHIFRVRLNRGTLLPEYMEQYLQQQKAKRYFLGCAKQTTGIASINMRQLTGLPVVVPEMQLQKEYVSFVHQVDKSKVKVQKALDETQKLFDSLMQQYFG